MYATEELVWVLHQGMWKTDFSAIYGTVAGGFEEHQERFQVWIERNGIECGLLWNK